MPNTRLKETRINLNCAPYTSFLSAYIYVRTSKPKKDGTVSSGWYLRINMPERKQLEESLKLDADERQLALEDGVDRLEELGARYDAGLDKKEKTFIDYADAYLEDALEGKRKNDKLIKAGYSPTHTNKIAKAIWNKHTYGQQESYYRRLIKPFFLQKKYDKSITKLTQKDIFAWDEWRKTEANQERDRPYSPASIQKHNTFIRMIFRWAKLEGERFVPPYLPEEDKDLAGRRRPEMGTDVFNAIYAELRKRNGMSGGSTPPQDMQEERIRNTDFLLYCYLELLEWTGIRGGLGENPIKMADIERIELDGKPQFYIHRTEKKKQYTSAGYRYFDKTLNRLDRFYKSKNMPDRTYLFEQYENRGKNWNKGDPIRGFNKRWQSVLNYLGVNEGKTTPQERIVLYSIRHRAIGRAIMQPNVNIFEVSRSFGTSVQMVEKIYFHYQVKKNYENLVETDISRYATCDIYNNYTGLVARQIEADTEEHFKLWEADPSIVEFEPNNQRERWT